PLTGIDAGRIEVAEVIDVGRNVERVDIVGRAVEERERDIATRMCGGRQIAPSVTRAAVIREIPPNPPRSARSLQFSRWRRRWAWRSSQSTCGMRPNLSVASLHS